MIFFLFWSVLAGLAVWWLARDTAAPQDTVIRVGPDEVKSLGDRLRDSLALVRINSPWALAWLLLAPYVLWIGVRFSFETSHWRSRLGILLTTGAGFIVASQWLSERVSTGRTMIVMVNYTADANLEKLPILLQATNLANGERFTNHVATNFTKVMISGSAVHASSSAAWETATDEIFANLPSNLPPLLAERFTTRLPKPGPPQPGRWSAALDGLAFIALLGLAHTGAFYQRYREREQQATLLTSRLNEARLHALQAQLQPHFLFNTLNGIATLLRRDPAKAEDMLLSLSELLRIALNSSQRQEIPLREEMDFLGRYLAIQKMRFGDRIEVIEEIQPAAMDCLVPALLLQPLVENAIRHGLEPSGKPGQLRITASRNGEWLKLSVEDNGVGLKSNSSGRTGVGLANVRERLTTLHGTAYEFELVGRSGGGVAVNIRLPARTESTATQPEVNLT